MLKGGVWKNGGKETEGEKGSAWAALQQLQQPVRTKERRKRRLLDCLRRGIFLHGLERKRGLGLMKKTVLECMVMFFLYSLLQSVCLETVEKEEEI